jgi:hypothetical protein
LSRGPGKSDLAVSRTSSPLAEASPHSGYRRRADARGRIVYAQSGGGGAPRDYGAVIDPSTMKVDVQATKAVRGAQRLLQRLQLSSPLILNVIHTKKADILLHYLLRVAMTTQ